MTRAAAAATALCALALLAFGALQFFLPVDLESAAGLDHGGVQHFERSLAGGPLPDLSTERFIWSYRLLLASAWSAYALALVAGWLGGRLARRWVWAAVIFVALVFAVLTPPSLSRDVYAYVANGRALVTYGVNPYVETLAQLSARGDEAAAFYPADSASIYGPIWMLLGAALVAAFAPAGLWGQVVAMKLAAAVATLVCAGCGSALARRHAPRHADLALLAIGLNPLLVIEGAGNGHNDLTMMALLLAGLLALERDKPVAGFTLVGLSIGVKFVSAAIVPWLVLVDASRRSGRAAPRSAALALVLTIAPALLGSLPFWSGAATLSSIRHIYDVQSHREGTASAASWIPLVLLLLVYIGLSVWLWGTRQPTRHLSAWTIFTLALPFIGMPIAFAWYLVWSLSVAPLRWNKLHVALLALGSFFAYVVQLGYVRPL